MYNEKNYNRITNKYKEYPWDLIPDEYFDKDEYYLLNLMLNLCMERLEEITKYNDTEEIEMIENYIKHLQKDLIIEEYPNYDWHLIPEEDFSRKSIRELLEDMFDLYRLHLKDLIIDKRYSVVTIYLDYMKEISRELEEKEDN